MRVKGVITQDVAEEFSSCYGCRAPNYERRQGVGRPAEVPTVIYRISIAPIGSGHYNSILVCPDCLAALRYVLGGPSR